MLVLQARPFNWWKTVLVAAMVGSIAFIMVIAWLRDFYALQFPPRQVVIEASIVALVAIALLEVGWRLSRVVANRRDVAPTTRPAYPPLHGGVREALAQSHFLRLNTRTGIAITSTIEPSANG